MSHRIKAAVRSAVMPACIALGLAAGWISWAVRTDKILILIAVWAGWAICTVGIATQVRMRSHRMLYISVAFVLFYGVAALIQLLAPA